MKVCLFEWIDDCGDLHLCTEHGTHETHCCGDDGCEATLPTVTGGGRWRRGTEVAAGRPKGASRRPHGTVPSYRKGCRCERCREANRTKQAERRERRRAET